MEKKGNRKKESIPVQIHFFGIICLDLLVCSRCPNQLIRSTVEQLRENNRMEELDKTKSDGRACFGILLVLQVNC